MRIPTKPTRGLKRIGADDLNDFLGHIHPNGPVPAIHFFLVTEEDLGHGFRTPQVLEHTIRLCENPMQSREVILDFKEGSTCESIQK